MGGTLRVAGLRTSWILSGQAGACDLVTGVTSGRSEGLAECDPSCPALLPGVDAFEARRCPKTWMAGLIPDYVRGRHDTERVTLAVIPGTLGVIPGERSEGRGSPSG